MAPVGAEFRANTVTANAQREPSVAADGAGDSVIVWQSDGQDGSDYGIYAQRYNAAGAALGSEFQVNTFTTGDQEGPSVGMDAAGDFVIAWESNGQDGSDFGIYAQRYNAAGAAQGSEFRANTFTPGRQYAPSVALDAGGDFVIGWQSFDQDGSFYGIYAQRYNAAGAAQGSEFPVNTYTTDDQLEPSVAMDAAGDFVIAWESFTQDGNGSGIYAQRYNAVGAAQGSEFRANTFTTNNQVNPSAAADAAGDFVIAWESYAQDGSGWGIYAQRYNAAGDAQGVEFAVNTFTTGQQISPSVAMDAAGDFVIAWQSKNEDGSNYGIYAQRYNAAGAAQGSEFRVNTFTTGAQQSPSIAIDAAGGLVIAWQSYGQDGSNYGIYAQRYATTRASAPAVNGEIKVNTFTAGDQQAPALAGNAAGDFVAVWESFGQAAPTTWSVYGQRYTAAGQPVGPEFLVNTTLTGDQREPAAAIDSAGNVTVVWTAADANGNGVFARRFAPDGTPQGNPFLVNQTSAGDQDQATVAADAAGDIVIAWRSAGQGIRARRYNAAGAAQGNEFVVNSSAPNGQQDPSVAIDAGGDFAVAWSAPDSSLLGVFMRRFSAAAQPQGDEFQVNQTTLDHQYAPSLAMDALGEIVVAWQSFVDPVTSLYDIFARRYDATGNPLGNEFLVPATTAADQLSPVVAFDPAGDFVIAWESYGQDGGGYGVYAQRYDAAGVPRIGEFQVNIATAGNQRLPALAVDAAGDFVIAWQSDGEAGLGNEVRAQRFSVTLPLAGDEFRINSAGEAGQRPAVAQAPDGSFVAVWDGPDADGAGIYGRRFGPDGAPVGGEFAVNTYTTNTQKSPAVSLDSHGDFVITWESFGQDGSGYGIFARRYSPAGLPLDAQEFQVNINVNAEENPRVASNAAGDFVVTFERDDGNPNDHRNVFARRYNAAGVPQGSEFQVTTPTNGNQQRAVAAMDAAGDFVVAWESKGQDGDGYGIYGQRYNAAGAAQGAEFLVNSFTTGDQRYPSIGMSAAGAFVIGWDGPGASGDGVYVRRFNAAGAPLGSEMRVNPTTGGAVAEVALDPLGDFAVSWNTYDGGGFGVYARRYDAAGAAATDEFRVNTTIDGVQQAPAVAMASRTRFVIAWQGGIVGAEGVLAQRFGANAAPMGANDLYVLSQSATSSASIIGGVLVNDSDPDHDPLTAMLGTGPLHGSLSLAANGSFSYSPGAGFHGLDRFTYRASDGILSSSPATVTLLSHNASIVRKFYRQVLNREPDDGGLQFWTTLVDGGAPFSNIFAGFYNSDERLNPIIGQYYVEFLLRQVEPSGLQFWKQKYIADGGPERVIAGMISSPEFFLSAGGTNDGYIRQLYLRLLGRQAEDSGLAYWTGHLNSGDMGRADVVLSFQFSDENRRLLIGDWYEQFLGRSPTTVESNLFLAQLQQGASQRQVQMYLIDSLEYRNSPAPPAAGVAVRLLS